VTDETPRRGQYRQWAALIVARRARQETVDEFHARIMWILRETGDSFGIVMKRIDLLSAQHPLPVLTFLLWAPGDQR